MILQFATFAIFVLLLTSVSEGKMFRRCQMASILVKNGFPRRDIPDWICMIYHESGFNTRIKNRKRDGSIDYGIFQINDKCWCAPPGPYNFCNIRCSKLVDDNIKDDMKCAKLIFRWRYFYAWKGWRKFCHRRNLRWYVKGCKY
ncbi:lysozyme c-1-like [Centruroides vittatus]|uniref:lysozyme c-1-like n=1 Tax=Centruroides vittatus TaxID=120091 RepID=UPI00350FB82D